MSRSRFDLEAFVFGGIRLVNETSHALKINIRLTDGSNQMFFLCVGDISLTFLEAGEHASVLRAWRVGIPGFYEKNVKTGRAYVFKF